MNADTDNTQPTGGAEPKRRVRWLNPTAQNDGRPTERSTDKEGEMATDTCDACGDPMESHEGQCDLCGKRIACGQGVVALGVCVVEDADGSAGMVEVMQYVCCGIVSAGKNGIEFTPDAPASA